MPKRIPITFLFAVAVGIIALFAAAEAGATCTQSQIDNYECSIDDFGYFEVSIVKPFPEYDSNNDTSTYRWTVDKLASPADASHFNLIIERNFLGIIPALDCDGSGDTSTGFAQWLTWNCNYKWDNLSGSSITLSLTVPGKYSSAPTDYFIKAGQFKAWGIILGPARFCQSVLGDFTPGVLEEVRTVKGVQIKFLRSPTTGCGIGVEIWNGSNWVPVLPTPAPTAGEEGQEGQPVVDCGGTRGQSGCLQECVVTAAESPGEIWINLGGTWYKIII
jgi:hypothetical protein